MMIILWGQVGKGEGYQSNESAVFGGYAIGCRVVKAYVKRTGKSVVDTAFVPAKEIIEESGFFAS